MAQLISNHGGAYDGAEMNLILKAGDDGNLQIGFTLDADTFLMAVSHEEGASIANTIKAFYRADYVEQFEVKCIACRKLSGRIITSDSFRFYCNECQEKSS